MEEKSQIKMKKTKEKSENYLDKVPKRDEKIRWSSDEKGIVTLEIDNVGIFNRIAQKLLKKPKISYVHLDEMGSFIWQLINEEKTIYEIGIYVENHFLEKANPLYERLIKYFKILESYGFIKFK